MTSQNTLPEKHARPIPYEEAQTIIAIPDVDPVPELRVLPPSSEVVFSRWLEENEAPVPSLFQRIVAMVWAMLGR